MQNSSSHQLGRRRFLAGTAASIGLAGATALMGGVRPARAAASELRILTMNLPFGEALRDGIAKEYEAKTGVKIVADVTPYDALQEKVFTELGAGSDSYDIFTTDCIWVGAAINSGWALSVDDLRAKDASLPELGWGTVIPAALPYVADLKGKRYGIPATLTTPSLIYRKDLFDKYGLKPPATWDDYFKLLDEGQKALKADGKTDTFVTTLIQASQNPGYSDWTFHLFGQGPGPDGKFVLDDAGNPIFNLDGKGVAALDALHAIMPYCPPGVLGFDYGEAANLYGSGKALMLLTWNDFYADMESPGATVAGLNGYVAIPKGKVQVNPVGGFQLFINARSRNPVEAYRFFAWMMEGRGFELIKEKGERGIMIPADLKDPAVLKVSPFLDTWNHIDNTAYIPVWFNNFTEVQRIIWEEVAASLAKQKTSQQAMESAETRVVKALKG
jgi:ABC-type glycerol-3-phosphate transport system substrate-binding protein